MSDLLTSAETAVKLAMKKGFEEAEAFTSKITKQEIIYRGRIEATKTNIIAGLGIRGIVDQRIGFFSISSLERRDIEYAIDQAFKIAIATNEDSDWKSLPREYGKTSVEKVVDKRVEQLTAKDLVSEVRLVLDTVREVDQSLEVTRGYIATGVSSNAIANSHGCKLERKETNAASWIAVKAGGSNGKGVSHEFSQSRHWRGLKNEPLARSVSERALKMLHAKTVPSGKLSTVWRNDVFGSVIDAMLTRIITADAIQKNRSPWAGKIGKPVASEQVSIVDEGTMAAGIGTRHFDDDGVPQKRVPVIEKGILRGFLYDCYTAYKENRKTTGNAHRDFGTFSSPPNYMKTPSPYPNNLIVKPQGASPDELIRETRNGLYIVETIGEWLSNPISGDLSATVASGFIIEKGELGRAVKGMIVSANFFDVLRGRMDLRANDLENAGPVYAPTTQVLDMTVSGE